MHMTTIGANDQSSLSTTATPSDSRTNKSVGQTLIQGMFGGMQHPGGRYNVLAGSQGHGNTAGGYGSIANLRVYRSDVGIANLDTTTTP